MSNDVFIRLRALKKAHNKKQADLAKIMNVDQATISRIEIRQTLIDEAQYQALVREFGEEEVTKYMGEAPWQNAVKNSQRQRKQSLRTSNQNEEQRLFTAEEMVSLAHVIAEQRKKIEELEEEIKKLRRK